MVLEKGPTSLDHMWISSVLGTILDCLFLIEWCWYSCQKSYNHICEGLLFMNVEMDFLFLQEKESLVF